MKDYQSPQIKLKDLRASTYPFKLVVFSYFVIVVAVGVMLWV